MVNQQQRNQEANYLLNIINNLEIGDQDKNRLKNAVGFNHRILSLGAFQERDNKWGVLSPLARYSSVMNTNFAVGNAGNMAIEEILGDNILGRQFSFNFEPFQKFIELIDDVPVDLKTREQINNGRGTLNLISEDLISVITSIRGMECCAFENCPCASNLTASFVRYLDGEQSYGAVVICRSHLLQHRNHDINMTMTAGMHLYMLTNAWQESLRNNNV
jgi:hypothetical protein